MLFLVHHGDAVGPDVDPMRPLSERGRAAVLLVAHETAKRGAKPDVIWHSGKLRARQTAEAFWRACNPFATLSAERGLQPMDPPEWMRDRLSGVTGETMVVGHMPHLARLLALLTGRGADVAQTALPLHGIIALEAEGDRWQERWSIGP